MHTVNGVEYSKATMVEIRGVYDGGLFLAHPRQSGGCGFAWHRWDQSDAYAKRLYDKAERYIEEWNERWYEDPRK